MAGIAFPTWAYQNISPFAQQVVQTQAALTALGSTWQTTPVVAPGTGGIAPADPGFTDTDIRLQQMLVEARVLNLMIAQGLNITDDPSTTLRADVLANDAGLGS